MARLHGHSRDRCVHSVDDTPVMLKKTIYFNSYFESEDVREDVKRLASWHVRDIHPQAVLPGTTCTNIVDLAREPRSSECHANSGSCHEMNHKMILISLGLLTEIHLYLAAVTSSPSCPII